MCITFRIVVDEFDVNFLNIYFNNVLHVKKFLMAEYEYEMCAACNINFETVKRIMLLDFVKKLRIMIASHQHNVR